METRFEELQDEKEDLTGTRFRLQRDRRKASHLIREKTDERMGSALSQLQRFLEEEGITLPRAIQKEFEQINRLRDQLGLREAEYDDAEQQYNDQEVKFVQRLSIFVDDLLDDLPRPLPTTSPEILESHASGAAELTSENLDDWTVLGRRTEDDYRRMDPHYWQIQLPLLQALKDNLRLRRTKSNYRMLQGLESDHGYPPIRESMCGSSV
ncbi:unnamed protein product [Alternaria alternata]